MLLWFHVYSRPACEEALQVLLEGDAPHPDPEKTTRVNERLLGIEPPRVYYYLGRPLELFGDSAVAYEFGSIVEGQASPFDTGGIIGYLVPVNDWEDAQRRAFLSDFTWQVTDLLDELRAYPGLTPPAVKAYLDATRPCCDGPGDRWIRESPRAPVWRNGGHWRAWTWECRAVPPAGGQGGLLRWSCSPARYAEIRQVADTLTDEDQIARMEALLALYVPGGMSTLVQQLRGLQELAA